MRFALCILISTGEMQGPQNPAKISRHVLASELHARSVLYNTVTTLDHGYGGGAATADYLFEKTCGGEELFIVYSTRGPSTNNSRRASVGRASLLSGTTWLRHVWLNCKRVH